MHLYKALQSALGLKITVIEGNAGVKVWRAEINHDHKSQEGSCRCGEGSTVSLSKDLGEKSLLIMARWVVATHRHGLCVAE
jgi:hypothetical protein